METAFNTTAAPEQKQSSSMAVAGKWALLGFLIQVIYETLFYYLNDGVYNPRPSEWYHAPIKLFIWLFPVFMAVKEYRATSEDNYLSFGKAFLCGFHYAWIYTLLCLLFYGLFYGFVLDWDAYMSDTMDKSIEAMKARGMSQEEISKSLSYTGFLTTRTFYLLVFAVMSLIFQTLAALLAAAILKRNRPNA